MGVFLSHNIVAQVVKSQNVIGEMILNNQSSVQNPIYSVPCATVNSNLYLTTAITIGDAVQNPLSYFSTSAPVGAYVNYSLTQTSIERAKTFQLTLIANKNFGNTSTAYLYAFADWDRDAVFETVLGKKEITGLSTKDVASASYTIAIPEFASLGKTRIRVYLTASDLANVNPTDAMASGFIYDFVMFTEENSGVSNSVLVAVSSNNTSWGNAIVATESPSSDGKYPINTSVTVRAITESFSEFVGWSNGAEIVSTDIEYTFSVQSPVYLIAVFNTVTPLLENPQASTVASPIWYQIKNAQTDSRLNRFIAYSNTIPAGYISALRIEKPEDFSDKFLWRLQESSNGMVKIQNKATDMQIASSGATGVALDVAATGADFMIVPSGNANGSFSIKYNNIGTSLLNGDLAYKLLLYNGGVGTGSGWFFYRIPSELLSANFKLNNTNYNVYSKQDFLCFKGMESGAEVTVFNLLGHSLLKYQVKSDNELVSFFPKGIFFVLVKNISGKLNTFKIIR
jgi:hypothetical protein